MTFTSFAALPHPPPAGVKVAPGRDRAASSAERCAGRQCAAEWGVAGRQAVHCLPSGQPAHRGQWQPGPLGPDVASSAPLADWPRLPAGQSEWRVASRLIGRVFRLVARGQPVSRTRLRLRISTVGTERVSSTRLAPPPPPTHTPLVSSTR